MGSAEAFRLQAKVSLCRDGFTRLEGVARHTGESGEMKYADKQNKKRQKQPGRGEPIRGYANNESVFRLGLTRYIRMASSLPDY